MRPSKRAVQTDSQDFRALPYRPTFKLTRMAEAPICDPGWKAQAFKDERGNIYERERDGEWERWWLVTLGETARGRVVYKADLKKAVPEEHRDCVDSDRGLSVPRVGNNRARRGRRGARVVSQAPTRQDPRDGEEPVRSGVYSGTSDWRTAVQWARVVYLGSPYSASRPAQEEAREVVWGYPLSRAPGVLVPSRFPHKRLDPRSSAFI
jgi:hypothetical protein